MRAAAASSAAVDLRANGVGDNGAVALGARCSRTRAASSSSTLSANRVGDRGASAIAEALKTHDACRVLRPRATPSGRAAPRRARAASCNQELHCLELAENAIGDARSVARLLMVNEFMTASGAASDAAAQGGGGGLAGCNARPRRASSVSPEGATRTG